MTTNNFEPEISNANLNATQYYIDDDGTLKFISPYIASSNFDGSIPVVEFTASAQNIKSGWLIKVASAQFVPVISTAYDDVDLTASPNDIITIKYLDTNNELKSKEYNKTDLISARYEDWDNKTLGEQGWTITYGGNAIFANVGVRGEIEATTLDVGGTDGITYDGNTVTIGASVIINAPLTVGGNFIVSGSAAQDIISNNTTITGGNIATGSIKSQGYSGPGTASAFSTSGMLINLDDGSITSNNFRINSSGSAFFKGEIVANSGLVNRLTVGGNDYPIENFIGQSGTNGGIILTTPAFATGPVKSLSINDLFVFKNSYYTGTATKDSISQGPGFFDTVKFIVLTASIGSIESEKNKYYCRLEQTGLLSVYDFSGVSGSGFFNTGNLIFGTASAFSEASGYTVIDGFIFNNIGLGTMWSQYVPDFIDSNGDFKLGKGTIAFNGTALTISGSASLQSFGYSGVTDGSAFSSNGMNINLRLGSITAKQFRIDDLGNAFFQGSINATSGSFSGWLRSASITGGIISSGSFVTGILQSRNYSGVTDGSAFSAKGSHINLNNGTLTAQQFRIDDLGNATFAGTLSAAGGTFSGNLSAAGGTFAGNLSAAGGTFAGNLSAAGGTFSGNITAKSFQTAVGLNNNNITIDDDTFSKSDKITFLSSNSISGASNRSSNTIEQQPNIQVEFKDYTSYTQKSLVLTGWKPPGILSSTGPSISISTKNDGTRSVGFVADSIFMNNSNVTALSFSGNGSGLTTLNGTNIATGTVAAARIDNLDAGKITTGTFATARIPTNINITGTSSNITAYNINQSVGTGNNVSFNTIATANAGSSIKPASFTNNQTTLQIRVSDSVIGIVGSTLNIKTDIVPLIGNQLRIVPNNKNGGDSSNLSFNPDSIFDITPVEYTVIEDESQERQVGFIVEDLLEVWPQAVTYNGAEPISYNTNSIVAGLVYAVKKQKKLIEDLESRMLQLESQLGG